MNAAVFCFSPAACELAEKLCGLLDLPLSAVHSTERYAAPHGFTSHKSVCADMGGLFRSHELLIFICACGIAVRDIAPHLKSKAEDPAVLVVDEAGKFVIPILSGHIGGANAYARTLAALTGAVPVITTATDLAGRFSCDAWASEHDCAISSLAAAKAVSAAILTGDVPISSEFPLPKLLPAGLVPGDAGGVGIYIGVRRETPYKTTLRLVPRILTLGVGCRRGTAADAISKAVAAAFDAANLDPAAISCVATADIKRDEAGLLKFAQNLGAPLKFYSADELSRAPGEFHDSDFVRRTVGVGGVCERAAVLSGATLMIPKTASNGVTVAVAARDWRVEF